jgi:two-component system nitrogen regulation sensor histidine kinase NtrY
VPEPAPRRLPSLRQRLLRHRKDHRLMLGALALLLLAATTVYVVLMRGRNLPDALIANRVLLFSLWYVDVLLILVVVFVLLRNLVKLVLERRSGLLGSKFKTKLVATYIGLALLPGSLLFLLGAGFLRGSIERWFDTPLEQVLGQAAAVARQLDDQVRTRAEHAARDVLADVGTLDLDDPEVRPELGRLLSADLSRHGLGVLGVYVDGAVVRAVVDPRSGLVDLPEPRRRLVAELGAGEVASDKLSPPGGGRLILAAVGGPPTASGGRLVVVAGILLGREVAEPSAELVESYQSYRQLVVLQDSLQASYLLLFLMVTLLILLASSWTGLYLARRITQPIGALVEATKRVSSGELGHRVEVATDDELGVLVDSFNRMTGELARNEALLSERNAALADANQGLAEERARLAAVLENVAAGVISLDGEGRIFTCNGAALAMLRAREQDVLGRPPAEAFADPERAKLLPLFADSTPLPRQLRLVLGGEWRTFEVKVTVIRDPSGRQHARVVVLEDLSELIQAQQLAAWNEAAKRIAHEINNPITPIRLSAERLLRRHAQGDADFPRTLAEGVDTIIRGVGTIKSMVDEFAQYARMPRPQPREVDLARLVRETVPLYEAIKPGVELAVDAPGDFPPLVADGEQLRRALINLLDNAIEATTAPGRVTVRLAVGEGVVSLVVADTGKGIPPDAKEKLFLPYFSTKGRGTGLGLAIVHRIVTDHRGSIRVADNSPSGTVFTIELPA